MKKIVREDKGARVLVISDDAAINSFARRLSLQERRRITVMIPGLSYDEPVDEQTMQMIRSHGGHVLIDGNWLLP